jgi:RNA polymerase sigma-70 factor, ECF subfamily
VRTRLRLTSQDSSLSSDDGIHAAVSAHSAELYGFACRALGDEALADDAVQEVFVRAWRAGDRFDPEIGTLRSWLFAILRNVIVDLARSRKARPVTDAAAEGTVEDQIDGVLRSWLVEEALQRLTAEHRRAVVEVYYRGRPARDVAAELGVPDSTVRTRLFYGLRAMRLALDELGWDDE